jgi:hypothetical protein
LLLPLWVSCKRKLGPAAVVLQGALDLCHAAAAPSGNSGASGGGGAHQVQQFVMTCPDGVRTPIAQPRALR